MTSAVGNRVSSNLTALINLFFVSVLFGLDYLLVFIADMFPVILQQLSLENKN